MLIGLDEGFLPSNVIVPETLPAKAFVLKIIPISKAKIQRNLLSTRITQHPFTNTKEYDNYLPGIDLSYYSLL